jgi:nucleotide-binding universal stress UspA family protein
MKTILIPTDFSEMAENAARYAVQLSRLSNARLILFHAYHVPVVTTEVPVVMPVREEIEEDTLNALKQLELKLKEKNPDVNIECACSYGLAVDEIVAYVEEKNIDLVVLGMQGAGYLSERLIGSVTTSLMRKVKCPLLVVDGENKYREIKKVVLAADYKEIQNKNTFEPLKTMVNMFGATVHVLNVVREPVGVLPTTEEAASGVRLEHYLEDVEHSFHYIENSDVVDGINEYVDSVQADMVVMIPRSHNAFRKIFHEPETKRMAFHTHVPLLILPDKS